MSGITVLPKLLGESAAGMVAPFLAPLFQATVAVLLCEMWRVVAGDWLFMLTLAGGGCGWFRAAGFC